LNILIIIVLGWATRDSFHSLFTKSSFELLLVFWEVAFLCLFLPPMFLFCVLLLCCYLVHWGFLITCYLSLDLISMLWLVYLLAWLLYCFWSLTWRYNLAIRNSQIQCQISYLHNI
jgi:hypothetical protein